MTSTRRLPIDEMINLLADPRTDALAQSCAAAILHDDDRSAFDAMIDLTDDQLDSIMTPAFAAHLCMIMELCPIHRCDDAICADDDADCRPMIAALDDAIADSMR
jgi:hypothetical protein